MDYQDNFFKEQLKVIQDAKDNKKEFGKSCAVADAHQRYFACSGFYNYSLYGMKTVMLVA